MKVKELIKALKKFDEELEVTITDGFLCEFYHTKRIDIKLFKDGDGPGVVDIGIGGCKEI
jgi:hypothetical protein